MRGRGAAFAACVLFLFGSSVASSAPVGAIPGSGCTRPIVISRLAFGPGTILPSQQSMARLAGRNCTKHPKTVKVAWSVRYTGASTAGCPAIAPSVQTITVPGGKGLAAKNAYVVPKGCEATALVVNAKLTDKGGKVISNKTATLRIAHKPVKNPE